jgi:hypothetical protein
MIEQLRSEIARRRKDHYTGQRWWSFAHHTTTFGAAILSVVVALVAPLKDWPLSFIGKDIFIVITSMIAAILAALSARGGFERKWIANRLTRSKLDILQIDLLDDRADASAIKESLKRIVTEHDTAIVSAASSAEGAKLK